MNKTKSEEVEESKREERRGNGEGVRCGENGVRKHGMEVWNVCCLTLTSLHHPATLPYSACARYGNVAGFFLHGVKATGNATKVC